MSEIDKYKNDEMVYLTDCGVIWHTDTVEQRLKAENEQLKKELSTIQHNCSREGCKYYDDGTFKVFYGCIAQKALQLSANSVTTKYCDLLKTITEIKEIAEKVYNDCDNCYEDTDTNCDVDCTLGGKAELAEQILQKIKEVRENEI